AEDGIRDRNVTGVQTCALPIFLFSFLFISGPRPRSSVLLSPAYNNPLISPLLGRDVGSGKSPVTMLRWCRQPSPSKATLALFPRSEERRVGKEWRSWCCADQ